MFSSASSNSGALILSNVAVSTRARGGLSRRVLGPAVVPSRPPRLWFYKRQRKPDRAGSTRIFEPNRTLNMSSQASHAPRIRRDISPCAISPATWPQK